MSDTNTIIVAGGETPRINASSQARVFDRLEKALNRDVPKWYVVAFEDQTEDPIFKDLISTGRSDVCPMNDANISPSNEPCVVLSILPPERLTDADWSDVKQFSASTCSGDSMILIGQKNSETVKQRSPIWRDTEFTQQGTYAVEKFMFHALERSS